MTDFLSRLFNPVTQLCDIRTVGHYYTGRDWSVATEYYCATHNHSFEIECSMFPPLLCDEALGIGLRNNPLYGGKKKNSWRSK